MNFSERDMLSKNMQEITYQLLTRSFGNVPIHFKTIYLLCVPDVFGRSLNNAGIPHASTTLLLNKPVFLRCKT